MDDQSNTANGGAFTSDRLCLSDSSVRKNIKTPTLIRLTKLFYIILLQFCFYFFTLPSLFIFTVVVLLKSGNI